jgi:hypothetical protein
MEINDINNLSPLKSAKQNKKYSNEIITILKQAGAKEF